MRGIKTFLITYQDGKDKESREWPGQTPEHAIKRFQRSRELANKGNVKLISVVEVKPQ